MATWTVTQLTSKDELPAFVKCQFASFTDNSLHDVVHPTPVIAQASHRQAIEERSKLRRGDEIIYLQAIDQSSGIIVGGIKGCFYTSDDTKKTSPYAAAMPDTAHASNEDEKYRVYVLEAFLGKRIKEIQGKHALIDILFVHPDYSRRGIGKALVSQFCSIADSRGLRGIVEASPEGKRTYELCGFQSQEAVTVLDEKRWPGKPEHLYYWMERVASG